MKKLIPFIVSACLTGFSASSGLPVIAGGCSNHINKKAEINCAENDAKCQDKNAEKFNLRDSLKS